MASDSFFFKNQIAHDVIEIIFNKLQTPKEVSMPFLLLVGEPYRLLHQYLLDKSKEILGQYWQQDLLYIQDFSHELGKTHPIKLDEEGSKEIADILKKQYNYTDISVREIIKRFSYSSLSGKKIVIFDNITRLTINAANALLKICEEPLPNRFIIATAPSITSVLPTLSSRAYIVRLSPVYEVPSFIEDYNIQWNKLNHYVDKFLFLQKLDTSGHLYPFLDYLVSQNPKIDLIYAKKQLQANTNKESILLQIAMNS